MPVYPLQNKYGVTIQTTFELAKFEELLAEIQKERPGEYKIEKTICTATSEASKRRGGNLREKLMHLLLSAVKTAPTQGIYMNISVCTTVKLHDHIETAAELKPEMFQWLHQKLA